MEFLRNLFHRWWGAVPPPLRPYVVVGVLLSFLTLALAELGVYLAGPDFLWSSPWGPVAARPVALAIRALVLILYGFFLGFLFLSTTVGGALRSVDWSTHPFPVAFVLGLARSVPFRQLWHWISLYFLLSIAMCWGLLPALALDLLWFLSTLAYSLLYERWVGPVEGLGDAMVRYVIIQGRRVPWYALAGVGSVAAYVGDRCLEGYRLHHQRDLKQLDHAHEQDLKQLDHAHEQEMKRLDNERLQLQREVLQLQREVLRQRSFFDWLWGRRGGGGPSSPDS